MLVSATLVGAVLVRSEDGGWCSMHATKMQKGVAIKAGENPVCAIDAITSEAVCMQLGEKVLALPADTGYVAVAIG